MKKLLSLVIALSLLIPNLASTLVYAKGNNQYATNTHSHDYSYSFTMSDVHPHSGNVECECGDVVSSTSMINEDCDICRKFLCEQGYHYYLASVHFEDLCYMRKNSNYTQATWMKEHIILPACSVKCTQTTMKITLTTLFSML